MIHFYLLRDLRSCLYNKIMSASGKKSERSRRGDSPKKKKRDEERREEEQEEEEIGEDLEQMNLDYENIKNMVESISEELLRVRMQHFETDTPTKQLAMQALRRSRVEFMKRKPVQYQEVLDKYIKKLLNSHFQDISNRVNEKNEEIRQLESSRRQEISEKELLKEELNLVNSKSRGLKEWSLVEFLVDELDRPEESAWIRTVKGQLRGYVSRFRNLSALKLSEEQSEKTFISRLMELSETSQEDMQRVRNYLVENEKKLKTATQEINNLKTAFEEQQVQLSKKESELEQRSKTNQQKEQSLSKKEEGIVLRQSKLDQQVSDWSKKCEDLQQKLVEERSQKEEWMKAGKKWNQIEQVAKRADLPANDKLKAIQSFFKLAQTDEELNRLAENWIVNQKIQECSVMFQRVLWQRLHRQKQELMEQGGLLSEFQSKAARMQNTVEQTIRLSIETFNEIQQTIAQRIFGSKLAPLKQAIAYDLENVVEVLTKEYHIRLSRICERMKLIRHKNERRIVEFVTRKQV